MSTGISATLKKKEHPTIQPSFEPSGVAGLRLYCYFFLVSGPSQIQTQTWEGNLYKEEIMLVGTACFMWVCMFAQRTTTPDCIGGSTAPARCLFRVHRWTSLTRPSCNQHAYTGLRICLLPGRCDKTPEKKLVMWWASMLLVGLHLFQLNSGPHKDHLSSGQIRWYPSGLLFISFC